MPTRRTGPARVERLISPCLEHRGGQAESARHIAVIYPVGVDRADILAIIEIEWQTDAVTLFDIALAVGEAIKHKTTGGGAERVRDQGPIAGLTVAYLEELG